MFDSYEQRGKIFKEAVFELGSKFKVQSSKSNRGTLNLEL
jgi:hypothetical protein